MAPPSAVFLDTSIFEGQGYNFESVAIKSFVEVAKARKLLLLLPAPTDQEVSRHIKQLSKQALSALRDARRKAPFLAKWKHFPNITDASLDGVLLTIAQQEYQSFLGNFDLKKLDYRDVDLSTIMFWYDMGLAPFGEKGKRKEFPDAIAFASVEAYARKHSSIVAVVSADHDFKGACDRYQSLLYFKTLPSLIELLLADQDKIDRARSAILMDASLIAAELAEDVAHWCVFYHEQRHYRVQASKVHNAEIAAIRIVGLGAGECTLTFEGTVEAEHHLAWAEWDGETDDDHEHEKWVLETSPITGTAKITLDPAFKVTKVLSLDTDIHDVELTENPRTGW